MRILKRGQGRPGAIYFVSAIVISSVIFGIGHLPVVVALGADFTLPIVAYVIVANSIFGLIAGCLYWKKGLEAAIIAHMSAHLVLASAIHFTQ
jgi:membrane protease YdiL (CAAX protease family)